MVLHRIILLAIIAYVAASVPISSPRHFTCSEYDGFWYVPASISKENLGVPIKCFSINVTKVNDKDETFEEDIFNISVLEQGEFENKGKRVGSVIDSEIHLQPADGLGEAVFKIFKFNNGQQIIADLKNDQHSFLMLSRTPTAPTDVVKQLVDFAGLFKGYVSYFPQDGCKYH